MLLFLRHHHPIGRRPPVVEARQAELTTCRYFPRMKNLCSQWQISLLGQGTLTTVWISGAVLSRMLWRRSRWEGSTNIKHCGVPALLLCPDGIYGMGRGRWGCRWKSHLWPFQVLKISEICALGPARLNMLHDSSPGLMPEKTLTPSYATHCNRIAQPSAENLCSDHHFPTSNQKHSFSGLFLLIF